MWTVCIDNSVPQLLSPRQNVYMCFSCAASTYVNTVQIAIYTTNLNDSFTEAVEAWADKFSVCL